MIFFFPLNSKGKVAHIKLQLEVALHEFVICDWKSLFDSVKIQHFIYFKKTLSMFTSSIITIMELIKILD